MLGEYTALWGMCQSLAYEKAPVSGVGNSLRRDSKLRNQAGATKAFLTHPRGIGILLLMTGKRGSSAVGGIILSCEVGR